MALGGKEWMPRLAVPHPPGIRPAVLQQGLKQMAADL
jgi:hypothetical protein